MKVNGKSILLCDCEGTMDFDAKSLAALFDGQDVVLNTHLCRSQIENFSKAVSDGEPMIVACTQEAPLFIEVAAETGGDTPISFANIRERAGWSDEAKSALPKFMPWGNSTAPSAPTSTVVLWPAALGGWRAAQRLGQLAERCPYRFAVQLGGR